MLALEKARGVYQRTFKADATLRDQDHFSAYNEGIRFNNLFTLYSALQRSQKGPCSVIVPLEFLPSELGLKEIDKQMSVPIYGVVRNGTDGDLIDFSVGDKTITGVPRNTSGNPEGLVGVSTEKNGDAVETINLKVFPDKKDLYYGGLVWIRTGPKPTISFVINHDHKKISTATLVKNHLKIYEKAIKAIQGILDFTPPVEN